MSRNELIGSIPSELGQLTQLEYLELDANWLNGSIPAELGNLTNLLHLDLSYNELSGSIPSELGGLTELAGLDLEENQFTGCVPQSIRLAGHTGVAGDVGLSWCDDDDRDGRPDRRSHHLRHGAGGPDPYGRHVRNLRRRWADQSELQLPVAGRRH